MVCYFLNTVQGILCLISEYCAKHFVSHMSDLYLVCMVMLMVISGTFLEESHQL